MITKRYGLRTTRLSENEIFITGIQSNCQGGVIDINCYDHFLKSRWYLSGIDSGQHRDLQYQHT